MKDLICHCPALVGEGWKEAGKANLKFTRLKQASAHSQRQESE